MLVKLRELRSAIAAADENLLSARSALKEAQNDLATAATEIQIEDAQRSIEANAENVAELELHAEEARRLYQEYRDECCRGRSCAIREPDGSLSHVGSDHLTCLARVEQEPRATLIELTDQVRADYEQTQKLKRRKLELESIINAQAELEATNAALAALKG